MRAFIFDTETTGLVSNTLMNEKHQPRVIEFYGHVVDEATGKAVCELEFLCNPGIPLSEEVINITGIKQEDIDDAPPFAEKADDVLALLSMSDTVVAHNLSYDRFVIDTEMKRLNKLVKWPQFTICTVEGTEHLKGHRLNLSALHEVLFGKPFSGSHRARADVEALTRCYLELLRLGEI